jgi:MFS family permease
METHSLKLNKQETKIVRLAALGGMLEFYDFIIYGIFSVYFAHQFFPSGNPLLSIIQSYVVFILGYVARPVGGMIFSHLGDEHGRKQVLIITIVLMGAASLGIGILPTYNSIGIAAPILLLLLRLLQGLALGGELPSTYVYISESLPKKQGSGFGITMLGVNSGLLLGMLINQALNFMLTPAELSAYGWRLPFIFGGLLCLVSYRIRKTLQETSAFNKIHDKPPFPIIYLLKHHFPEFITGTAITAIMSGLVVVTIVFMPTYLHDILKVNNTFISYSIPLAMLCNTVMIYYTGQLANKISPHTILGCLVWVSMALIPFSYWLISNNSHAIVIIGLIILCLLEGIAAMIVPLIICSLFPTKIRLTGVALCYNVGFTLFGGLAPVIISSLINAGYNIYLTPIIYLLTVVAICGFGLRVYATRNNFVADLV